MDIGAGLKQTSPPCLSLHAAHQTVHAHLSLARLKPGWDSIYVAIVDHWDKQDVAPIDLFCLKADYSRLTCQYRLHGTHVNAVHT